MSKVKINYLWGDQAPKPVVPTIEHKFFNEMGIMLSAFPFHKLDRRYEELKEIGIRKYIGLSEDDSRNLIIDSGKKKK